MISLQVTHCTCSVDSPQPPLPPQSPQQNRFDVESIRRACGDATADELEKKMLENGREIAPR